MLKRTDYGAVTVMMEEKQTSQVKTTTAKAADPRTLFVKFHPPSASVTRRHLLDHFSNYGPVNRCSVIRQSKSNRWRWGSDAPTDSAREQFNSGRGSRGYGFVRFVHEGDAKSAAYVIQKKSGGGRKGGGEFMVADGVRYRIHAERASDAAAAVTASSARREGWVDDGVAEEDARRVGDAGDVATCDVPRKDLDLMSEARRKRTSRVIVRNLSFYANEHHVRSTMESEFGPVAAIDLPLVPGLPKGGGGNDDEYNDNLKKRSQAKKNKNSVPRHRGFAFVTFTNASAARQAVERGSEVKIKKRVVAIDFSVSKTEHLKMKEMRDREEEVGDTEINFDKDSNGDQDNETIIENDNGNDGGNDSVSNGGENDILKSNEEGDGDLESQSDDKSEDGEESAEVNEVQIKDGKDGVVKEAPHFNTAEVNRTLFLRNVPFDATRRDVLELFHKFGHVEAVYLVKDRQTAVFKGTAFVRFENEEGCAAAMEASVASNSAELTEGGQLSMTWQQFVSSKNMAMGLGWQGGTPGLTLKGRRVHVDLVVDRATASSLAVQRDADGRPIKKANGKDRRNIYLKNEGRVSAAADGADARSTGAQHGGVWEDLPSGDRARRERAFADKSTKLRSPLFFVNPKRLSIRNLAKHITEAELKRLVFAALKTGLEQRLVTARDAVSHWRAGGELPHSELMRRATDPDLVTPPLDEKNMKGSVLSVFIDRDLSGGQKTAYAPSKGFGFVEFTHHTHALAVLRQLNNNPMYSADYAAGGKHVVETAKGKRGKKGRKQKADHEIRSEFLSGNGKVCVPRLIVEFAVENKLKARQQAEKLVQKRANKIKQRIHDKEKWQRQPSNEIRKSRGALQREKKRARKDAMEDDCDMQDTKGEKDSISPKKWESNGENGALPEMPMERKWNMVKPQKSHKVDIHEDALEDMISAYKSSFPRGVAEGKTTVKAGSNVTKPRKCYREVMKKRWFE